MTGAATMGQREHVGTETCSSKATALKQQLSTALFDDGLACGACFEIACVNDRRWCIEGAAPIRITATNFCPPNYSKPDDNWCNPPLQHFHLSMPMFTRIAHYKVGIVPVAYRRVQCIKHSGVKFEIKGNPNWILVLVYNVGGAGSVSSVSIKGSGTGWIQMSRNWGQNWQTGTHLVGQSLSFQVTVSDGNTKQFLEVAPSNWQFGQSFVGQNNF